MIYVIGILCMLVFAAVNLYIGITIFETFRYFMPSVNSYIYWTIFLLIVLSFFIGKLSKKFYLSLQLKYSIQ